MSRDTCVVTCDKNIIYEQLLYNKGPLQFAVERITYTDINCFVALSFHLLISLLYF